MGLKLNEYGLWREGDDTAPLPTPDEAALYRHLGLDYIEPELREAQGEIEAAGNGTLPELVRPADIRGVIHCHSTWSDGHHSIEEMARASQAAGYAYLCICDHSQSAYYAGGLRPDAVRRQWDEIDRLNEKLKGFRVFKGIESDILSEGDLDYGDSLLAGFDLVVASIHSRMQMAGEEMTRRICRALEHPATTILGHPTGRLLLRREPYDLDMERIVETAARAGVVLEINAHPMRLDLDWRAIRRARAAGCRFAVNPDAHETGGIADIAWGVGIARKGWLTAADVLNTLDARELADWLARRRAGR
jgi:DNA polymerase (family 10)